MVCEATIALIFIRGKAEPRGSSVPTETPTDAPEIFKRALDPHLVAVRMQECRADPLVSGGYNAKAKTRKWPLAFFVEIAFNLSKSCSMRRPCSFL